MSTEQELEMHRKIAEGIATGITRFTQCAKNLLTDIENFANKFSQETKNANTATSTATQDENETRKLKL